MSVLPENKPMVSEAQFSDWLNSGSRKPVWSLEILAEVDGAIKTLYASDRDYLHPTKTFYGVMHTPIITQSLSRSVIANFSEIGFGNVTLDDLNGGLDEWRTYRHTSAIIRLGDSNWNYSDHRPMLTGSITSWSANGGQHELILRDNQSKADSLISFEDLTVTTGAGGVLLKGLLLDSGAFTESQIDQTSFDALDAKYPYTLTISTFADLKNALTVGDEILAGLPVDYGINVLNQVEIRFFDRPNLTGYKRVTLLARPQIGEALFPLGKLTLTNEAYTSVETSEATILDHYGANASEESIAVSISNTADATALAEQRMALLNDVVDSVTLIIHQTNLVLGETIYFEYPGLGFAKGVYGVVTDLELSGSDSMNIEVAIWR